MNQTEEQNTLTDKQISSLLPEGDSMGRLVSKKEIIKQIRTLGYTDFEALKNAFETDNHYPIGRYGRKYYWREG